MKGHLFSTPYYFEGDQRRCAIKIRFANALKFPFISIRCVVDSGAFCGLIKVWHQ